jgi:hypothetical protein
MTGTGWLGALSLLGPVATGAAAMMALAVGVATIRQRDRADQREQWWKRAQWALELTHADDAALTTRGYAALEHLARSDLATADEQRLLEALLEVGLRPDDARAEDGDGALGGRDEEEVSGGPDRAGDRGPDPQA